MPTETAAHDFGLPLGTQAKMQAVFARYPQVDEVKLYGSRAKGNFKRGSDIDLTIISQAMNSSILTALENDLDDLLLPYKIDLSLLAEIDNPDLLADIERTGVEFYRR